MRVLLQTDMKDKKTKQRGSGTGKKAKQSFKSKSRDNDLHRLLFMPNGLPDGAELAYYVKGHDYRHIYILPMDLHSGHHLVEDQKATETQIDTPVKKFGTESDSKLRRSYIECQHNMIWFSSSLCTFDILAIRFLICSDEVTACKRILEKVGLKGYQIGKTKVFLRAGQMAELDTYRSEILGKSVSIIQRKVRSYLFRRSFISIRLSAIQIQAASRGVTTQNKS
ncbi:unnamed protein product [Trifolium pratense]|uniref:Uncharacterized protein n=1 Tax=Trifolium pratense TaxID=57577 RepID=A0ACB0JL48_TRIPR|nr:unnamed protein product [Trifolium pratense]